ncbi:MAG: alpha/beta hydrolase [Anaerolineae bacterium]|nr:alpha/beta hydrolase [Anaerolineae bacterium]MCB9132056.1 alpha/beta hydrolase [Anaerolineales bacterium]MCB0243066.1 alpha/beta hydrolase [Anaerolineae bacterium]MCB0247728.1 alpha/beta hydrolase [Anaerolineae bacterium]MCB9141904.1 alpha/beta hydrolase [Anaerolineales bacterium]
MKVLIAVVAVFAIAVVAFVIWGSTPLGPMPEALAALESDANVAVATDPWLSFTPTQGAQNTGLIFYPGGRVDPRSYAPMARAIAEAGYPVVIVPMPLNLAVFGVNRAADVIAAHPEVEHWVIGGHSLGGSMAASFTRNNPDLIDGLFLVASYPASSDDLSGFDDLTTYSVSATNDGLATPDKIDASRPLLPADTIWVPIEGGNHAQFGYYGDQPGDGQATISREEQQRQTVEAALQMLSTVSAGS